MRILILNSEFPPIGGGAANASANLAREFAALGQDVTVLTVRFGRLPKEEVQAGVRILRAAGLRRRPDRSGAFEQLVFILAGGWSSIGIVRRWKPDVCLAFFGAPSGVIALGLMLLRGLPYVVSLRGGDVPGFRPYDFRRYHQMIGPLLHMVWRRASAVVANSQGLRELALRFDPDVPIPIVHNGVDAQRFAATERAWEPARLLLVGRLVHQKGVDLLLNALRGMRSAPWELMVVGDGPLRASLVQSAAHAGLTDRIRFAGWLSNEALVKAYAGASLFVLPSRHEGMPNVVLEAMSSGLPVIASRIAGNEELVVDGLTGLLVPPEDVEGLRQALAKLIDDPDSRRAMGLAGRRRVEQAFSWRSSAESYIEILRTAVV